MMFLHLGDDHSIPTKKLIAILDYESSMNAEISSEFLEIAERENIVNRIGDGPHKSFILTDDSIVFSPISSSTLQKRAKNGHDFED